MTRILLLEDEPTLNEILSDFLTSEGYKVQAVKTYDEALEYASRGFDVFLFDVKIIGGNGFELLRELRESGVKTPCIFVTSLNGIEDVKKGFRMGCDDYIKKPFELCELSLRIENILKREYGSKVVKINNELSFDVMQKQVMKNGLALSVPKKECDLLALLLANADSTVSREEIYSHLWGYEEPSEMSLRVYIRNLRKLIGEEKIIAHHKIGYEYRSEL